jgi:hypothetical protein
MAYLINDDAAGVDSVIHVAVPIPFGAPNQEENLKVCIAQPGGPL